MAFAVASHLLFGEAPTGDGDTVVWVLFETKIASNATKIDAVVIVDLRVRRGPDQR